MLPSQLVSSVGGWKEVSFAPNQKPSLPPPQTWAGRGKGRLEGPRCLCPPPRHQLRPHFCSRMALEPSHWEGGGGGRNCLDCCKGTERDKVQGRALTVLIAF